MELYDLTNPQKSIWVMEQFYKGTAVNNICGTVLIHEPVNFSKLYEAICTFVKSNNSFRIKLCFNEQNEISQYFDDNFEIDTNVKILSNDIELHTLEKELVSVPFQLLNSQLFKFQLFKFSNNHGGFVLNTHHLISDACTASLVANQIISVYSSLQKEETPEDITHSYLDYINSEKEYINSDKFIKDKAYWNDLFNVMPDMATLSSNSSTDITHNCAAKRANYKIDNNLLNKINDYCKEYKISIFNFFMAVYSIYIGKIQNLNNFVIGTPILNRTTFKEKNTPGMFISTVPFKIDLTTDLTFKDFVANIALQTLGMFRHQKYPYQSLLADIRANNNSIPNLYNIMISYQNTKTNRNSSDINYDVRWIHSDFTSDELDVHLFDMNDTGELNISYDYQTERYSDEDIHDIHQRILFIINQILSNNDISISSLELVLPEEKTYMLKAYNTSKYTNINKTVIDLFLEQCQIHPDSIAISDKTTSLTYGQLNALSDNIKYYLFKNNIRPKDKICLFFPNSINLVASILAVLKLGACYIPVDVTYPIDRIEYIVHNSSSKHILTDSENIEKLGILRSLSLSINFKNFSNSETVQDIDEDMLPSPKDLAYIIYTSGSTGNPKGVKIAHESLCNYISWAKSVYVKNEVTNFPLYSSISFDLTVTSIYTPLISGNAIYIYNNSNPQLLLQDILTDNKVQIIKLTPAHLSLLLECIPNPNVKKLIVGGDILSIEICKQISSLFANNIHIYNEYGPTEATVGCMIYEYSNTDKDNYASVPIGIPAANTKLYVLNDDLNLVPFGHIGQLYICGKCLAKGYVKLRNTNSERFIQSPFNSNEKIYKTGDLVKLHKNGIMEYIGRSDFQIKINGYRIEIGEIQSKILNYPGIKDCFINVIEKDKTKLLCAYYVCKKPINLKYLKDHLSRSLPSYMIPKHFILLDELPLTNNGKVDKKLLPLPTESGHDVFIGPETLTEQKIHSIFCKLLNIDKMSVTANIFDYYVDSLIIIKAQTILYSQGYDISSQTFYEHPSIRSLAEYLDNYSTSNKPIKEENISLIKTIDSISLPNNCISNKYQNILLFGVTGFLGIHILYELLTTTSSTIYCIIRKKDNLNAIQRFHNKFEFYFGKEIFRKYEDRIIPITGNLLKDNLGLYDEVYLHLGQIIDCVISTAAIVKHYGNYDEFNATNVLGTDRIIDFCLKYNISMHYISTMSVSGYGLVKTPKETFTENDCYIGQNFEDNVYVKSKFVAEQHILESCKSKGLHCSIYRIGNITNRFSDGFFQQNYGDNAFLNRIISIIKLKSIPENLENLEIELTPVDYCAKFIVKLLHTTPNNINVYHIYNDNQVKLSHFIDILEKYNIHISKIPFEDFENKILNSNDNYFGITNYISAITSPTFNNLKLSNVKTNNILKENGLNWPDITDDYINKIIDYLIRNGLMVI